LLKQVISKEYIDKITHTVTQQKALLGVKAKMT